MNEELLVGSRLGVGAALLSLLVAVVVPTIRMRALTGRSGYVADRPPTAIHKLAIDGMRVAVVAALGWGVAFFLLRPVQLGVWPTSALHVALGWTLILGGAALTVVAQLQMGNSWRIGIDTETRTALVTGGLFSLMRNPIFSGILLVVLGLVALTPSAWSIMGWLFVFFLIALQTRLEEEHLLQHHGEKYQAYAARVGRFVPGIGRLPSTAEVASHG